MKQRYTKQCIAAMTRYGRYILAYCPNAAKRRKYRINGAKPPIYAETAEQAKALIQERIDYYDSIQRNYRKEL